jgi:hypothetical protein
MFFFCFFTRSSVLLVDFEINNNIALATRNWGIKQIETSKKKTRRKNNTQQSIANPNERDKLKEILNLGNML